MIIYLFIILSNIFLYLFIQLVLMCTTNQQISFFPVIKLIFFFLVIIIIVYKRSSKTSQLKFHKFLKSRQDSRTLQLKKQLRESKASLIMLRREVTNLTLEVEETEERR